MGGQYKSPIIATAEMISRSDADLPVKRGEG
jgi:hypothetical protein